jgi:hypothetical protein
MKANFESVLISGYIPTAENPVEIEHLYQQAYGGSQKLRSDLSKSNSFFDDLAQFLTEGKDRLVAKSLPECLRYREKLNKYTNEIASEIDPYYGLPILLQAITDYYFTKGEKQANWLGVPLKTALALVWKNVHESHEYSGEMIARLEILVTAIDLTQSIDAYCAMYEYLAEDRDQNLDWVEFFADGYSSAGANFDLIKSQMADTFNQRGADVYRTVKDSVDTILEKPFEALQAIIRIVLLGKKPETQNVFRGTIFAEITGSEQKTFWVKLFCLLELLEFVEKSSLAAPMPVSSIAIFETPFIKVHWSNLEISDKSKIQQVIYSLLWKQDWWRSKQGSQDFANSVVERPALRISSKRELFIASPLSMVDTINWFVEASIMGYKDSGGVKVADRLRQEITDRFEIQVQELFRNHGCNAGKVTENGVWLMDKNKMPVIKHPQNRKNPGEIDILAYQPETQWLYVVECKVLNLPLVAKNIRNVDAKLNDRSKEKFHTKLNKKSKWIQESINWFADQGYPIQEVINVIVLDRFLPGMPIPDEKDNEIINVIVYKNLVEFLLESKGKNIQ